MSGGGRFLEKRCPLIYVVTWGWVAHPLPCFLRNGSIGSLWLSIGGYCETHSLWNVHSSLVHTDSVGGTRIVLRSEPKTVGKHVPVPSRIKRSHAAAPTSHMRDIQIGKQ